MKNQYVQVNNTIKTRGFTLIELLVVIAIMSIVIGIGGNTFVEASKKLQVQKAANNLLVTAKYARMSAIEQQTVYKLYLDTINNEFYLVTTLFDEESGMVEEIIVHDNYCKPIVLEGIITFEDIQVLSNDYVSGNRTDDIYIVVFYPDGTAETALIQIGDQKTHYSLSINAITGNSKLYPTILDEVPIDTIDLDSEYY